MSAPNAPPSSLLAVRIALAAWLLCVAARLHAQGTPPRLTGITLDADSLESGRQSGGRVTLAAPAPAGGAIVTLSSTPPQILSLPPQVVVPANQASARFTFTAGTVANRTTVAVLATHNGVSFNDTLAIDPPDPDPPETLEIGEFTLAVSNYSDADWHAASGTFQHAAGTATLTLPCAGGAMLQLTFSELTIDPAPGDPDLGTVVAGSVSYPGSPPPPVVIDAAGFRILVDALTLAPGGAEADMRVELPAGLIDAGATASGCQRPSILLEGADFHANCRVFEILPSQRFGPWMLGPLGITVGGTGLVVDLSTTDSAPTPPYPFTIPAWRGLILVDGDTAAVPTAVANTGYLLGEYDFSHARVTSAGFTGELVAPFSNVFNTLVPLNFRVQFDAGTLNVVNSAIASGELRQGTIRVPTIAAVDESRSTVEFEFESLAVQADLDLVGRVTGTEELFWGELTNPSSNSRVVAYSIDPATLDGAFYLRGTPGTEYLPLALDGSFLRPSINDDLSLIADVQAGNVQGVTLIYDGPSAAPFRIYTADTPGGSTQPLPEPITPSELFDPWITIGSRGVHGQLRAFLMPDNGQQDLGPTYRADYEGGNAAGTSDPAPFNASFIVDLEDPSPDGLHLLLFKFVDSAVYESDGQGKVTLPAPAGMQLDFKDINITSTARIAAARIAVDMAAPPELDYWEIQLQQRSDAAYAGVMHVPSGRIFLTQAGLFEPRHFREPFWLTWAVLQANGGFGELEFDYNHTGQRFDGLPFVPELLALSDHDPDDADKSEAFLQAAGTIHLDFFGAYDLDIRDHVHLAPDQVNGGRDIVLASDGLNGAAPSELEIAGNWAGAFGQMWFVIDYDRGDHDGFVGPGTTGLALVEGSLEGSVDISRARSCISIHDGIDDGYESVSVRGFSNFSSLGRTTGCGCIEKGVLKRMHLQSEEEDTAALNYLIRTGTYKSQEIDITPSSIRLDVHGNLSLNMGPGLIDTTVDGHARFVIDLDEDFVEGHVDGRIDASSFLNLAGALGAEGQLSWHVGDIGEGGYHSLQGKVAVAVMTPLSITGMGVEGGFYAGLNAPSAEAWVLDTDSKYVDFVLPARLTGVYGCAKYSRSLNLYVISGGYELHGGLGLFVDAGIPGAFGQMQAHFWGKLLGGLLSASAWSELILQAHPLHPAFSGAVGLEVCALFVCADVGLAIEVSKNGVDIDF